MCIPYHIYLQYSSLRTTNVSALHWSGYKYEVEWYKHSHSGFSIVHNLSLQSQKIIPSSRMKYAKKVLSALVLICALRVIESSSDQLALFESNPDQTASRVFRVVLSTSGQLKLAPYPQQVRHQKLVYWALVFGCTIKSFAYRVRVDDGFQLALD